MGIHTQKTLSEQDVTKGMNVMMIDGLASETMTTLTTGTFLVAVALLSGASNFQIGLLAALPTGTNILQLVSIWLCRQIKNRRLICVVLSILARMPLVALGAIVILSNQISFPLIVGFLFIYYAMGSIAGPVWNAWIKDLVPEKALGYFFSKRTRYMQILNATLGIAVALLLDYIKQHYPDLELNTYGYMFTAAGIAGICGAIILSRAPEPEVMFTRGNIFQLLGKPLKDRNFTKLLTFNSLWIFAVNIATPFFTVFMMKSLGLSLTYIMALTLISQVFSILTLEIWGKYSDRYSNKNIIAIGGPLYIICLIAWCFVGINSSLYINLILLTAIYAFMGISTAGINLSLTNISIKLSPADQAVVYLSTKNIITALFSALAPLIGGTLVDFFATRSLEVKAQWTGPQSEKTLYLISLHQWNFLFIIGAFLAFISLELLIAVKERGEVQKREVVRVMRGNLKNDLKAYFILGHIISFHERFIEILRKREQH